MGFEYKYTCPEIDSAIGDLQQDIERNVNDLLDEACPILGGESKIVFVNGYLKTFNREVIDHFETARQTNMDMRAEAERQIEAVEKRAEEAESEVANLESKIKDLEDLISEYEDTISDLEEKLQN
jgi:chromosome segregation ATPase